MMDSELTNKIQKWIETPAANRDIAAGAEILLQLNRNKFLYFNIIRNPKDLGPKLEYELKRYLQIRLDGMTSHDIEEMEQKIVPQVKENLDASTPIVSTDADQAEVKNSGKRDDHNELPQEIQELYDKNGDIYFKMKQTFETLKTLENALPCDRYEYLKILVDLDKQYRANWEKYDNYVDGDENEDPKNVVNMPSVQAVSAARKFLSSNSSKLSDLLTANDQENAGKLLETMQEKVELIKASNGSFKPDYQEKLETLGLQF